MTLPAGPHAANLSHEYFQGGAFAAYVDTALEVSARLPSPVAQWQETKTTLARNTRCGILHVTLLNRTSAALDTTACGPAIRFGISAAHNHSSRSLPPSSTFCSRRNSVTQAILHTHIMFRNLERQEYRRWSQVTCVLARQQPQHPSRWPPVHTYTSTQYMQDQVAFFMHEAERYRPSAIPHTEFRNRRSESCQHPSNQSVSDDESLRVSEICRISILLNCGRWSSRARTGVLAEEDAEEAAQGGRRCGRAAR